MHAYSRVERDHHGHPRVSFPRPYNAAVDLVDRHVAGGRGDRVAYRHAGGVTTYAALAERANRAGQALRALGVRREERVALVMLDGVDFVAVFLGALKIGAVPVPLSTLLTTPDYAYMLHDCRARVVVVSAPLLERVRHAAVIEHLVVAPAGTPGALDLHALLAAASPHLDAAETSADEVAFWLYSSGSTGRPKGAMHLHGHLARTAAYYAQGVLGLAPDDVVYSAARLFFAYGLGNSLTFPLYVGASAVLEEERPSPEVVARVLAAQPITVFAAVPTLFAQLLAHGAVGREAAPQLRVSTSAGEALPAHLGERWRAAMGSDILDGIGSTELLHIFLSNRVDDVRYGTTGTPVPGYAVKLVGDDGHEVGRGGEGALWVRGETAAIGYFGQRERSLATFHGPWTRTGDRYLWRDDGAFVYAGREDDMLKVGGIWVSPFEVESALAAHPAVLEAAVIGAADEHGLIKPKAFVVPAPGHAASATLEEALKAHVRDRLAAFKYPRWIVFVDELPKTATGKVQRFRLRAPSP